MTIRLKLTLVYSLILTLVVVLFSIALYTLQGRAAFSIVERSLTAIHKRTVDPGHPSQDGDQRSRPPLPPDRFNQPLVQLRDVENNVLQKSDSLGDASLPLSDAGFASVLQGEAWLERAFVEEAWFLIRSQLDRPAEPEALGTDTTGADSSETDSSEADSTIVQVALPVSNQIEYLEWLRTFLIFGDFIVILAALGIGWFVAGLTLRPIHRITQAAKLVGMERDFNRRVPHPGPNDEIGQLATTFNGMLTQLQEAYMQITEVLQVQRRFVADASHELRTPLTTIRGNLELLKDQQALDDEVRADIFSDTISETERLMRLVNDLLTLARSDTQQPIQAEQVAVRPLLDDVCRQAQLLDAEHTVICQTDVEAVVEGNSDALKQMLLILLDNAFKHTPPETTVIVSTTLYDEHVEICVQDDGPGIDAGNLPYIFERFYRGDTVRTGEGAGLGLSIVKELVEAQNGTISVQSILGSGSVFTLSLPKHL